MPDTKYDKYFLKYDPPPGFNFVMGPIIKRTDARTIEGSNFYFIHWVLPHETPNMKIGHPPHIHSEAELLIHIGTDLDNPEDLGAEVEIYMGPEQDAFFNQGLGMKVFVKRPGTPEDIAGAALFLGSELGAYVTCQALCVAGGLPQLP
jgi:hypothetical protein